MKEWLVSIDDLSDFVATQRRNVHTHGWAELVTPREEPYPVTNPDVIRKLRLDW